MVYSKAVVPELVLLFVALWFILRGDLFYVLPCVILFLCLSVLLALRLPRLGKRELILVLFIRLFDLCLFGFVVPLGVWEGLRFVIVALPRLFSYFSYVTFALPLFSVSILHKSIAGRYQPVRVADGPITARCRFINNASWVCISICSSLGSSRGLCVVIGRINWVFSHTFARVKQVSAASSISTDCTNPAVFLCFFVRARWFHT